MMAQPLQPIPVTKPEAWRTIGIDLVGPLRETANGNKYICTTTCYYTKMANAKALPTKEAQGVATFLLELFLRLGFPKVIISDQGREFNNTVVDGITQALGIGHRRTSAYHPQCNGLTERFNQTLESMILKTDEAEWDRVLDQVVFAYNTSKHATTGFSPFFLMYGREPILPEDVDEDVDEANDEPAVEETPGTSSALCVKEVSKRLKRMSEVVGKRVLQNIEKTQKRQKYHHDKRHVMQQDMAVGTKVLKKNLRRQDRKGGKEEMPWIGPYTIRAVTKSGCYLLTNEDGLPLKSAINGSNLKLWTE